MEVKFNLRDGQTITAEFEDDLGDLKNFFSRALGKTDRTYVATLKAKDGIFFVRMTDVVSIKIPS